LHSPLRDGVASELPSHVPLALYSDRVSQQRSPNQSLCLFNIMSWSVDATRCPIGNIVGRVESTHIGLPEQIAHDDRDEAGVHEGDECGARRPAEVAPAVFVQL
jgi:hypothetical protein